ncbi:MAG: hypothetical protein ACFFCD_07430 [Promethearchaeota archaeon]
MTSVLKEIAEIRKNRKINEISTDFRDFLNKDSKKFLKALQQQEGVNITLQRPLQDLFPGLSIVIVPKVENKLLDINLSEKSFSSLNSLDKAIIVPEKLTRDFFVQLVDVIEGAFEEILIY